MNVAELVIDMVLNARGARAEVRRVDNDLAKTKADADKAGKALQDAADKGASSWGGFAKVLGGALVALGGAAVVLSSIGTYVDQAAALDRTSQSLGLSIERLQAWQGAVQAAGGEAEEAADRFRDLSDYIIDATQFDSGPLKDIAAKLGISLKDAQGHARNTEDVMLDLADAFQRVGSQASTAYGMQMSFDPATIALLQKGRGELTALLALEEERAVYSKRDAEAARKQQLAMQALTRAWDRFVAGIVRVFMPVITGLTEAFGKVADVLGDNARAIGIALALLAGVIMLTLVPALTSMAAAGLAAIAPFAPIIALVGALALVIDDLLTYMEGGESTLADFWAIFGTGEEIAARLGIVWENIKTILDGVFDVLGGIGKLVDALFSKDADSLQDALRQIGAGFEKIGAVLGNLISYISDLKDELLDLLPDWMKPFLGVDSPVARAETWEDARALLYPSSGGEHGDERSLKTWEDARALLQRADAQPPVGMQNVSTRTSTTNIGEINLTTQATDPQGVADAVSDTLYNRTAQADSAFGV